MTVDTRALRHVADVLVSNVDKKRAEGEPVVRLCNYTDVYYQTTITAALDFMPATAGAAQIARFGLRAGDSIVTKDSETAADIAVPAYVPQDLPGVVCGYHLAIIRPRAASIYPSFLGWALQSDFMRGQFAARASGVTRYGLTYEAIQGARVPLSLTLEEQRRIADFLDDQIARIDAAARLRRRQAHACLEAMASWLEEAFECEPASLPVKAVTTLITSGPRGWGEYVGKEGWPFLRIANLPRQGISVDRTDLAFVQAPPGPERERTRTRAGDVLLSITAELGSTAVVPSDLADANVSQHVALLRPASAICHPAWLAWSLQVPVRRVALTTSGYGGTKAGLGLSEVANVRIPDLPLKRQVALAARAEEEWRLRTSLRELLNEQQRLLEERTHSLITAAVMGEFDVASAGPRAAAAVTA